MEINNLKIGGMFPDELQKGKKSSGEDFTTMMKDFINDVNNKQHIAQNKTEEFIQGGNVEVHDVMIAGEKAKTSIELLLQIRNKTLDMYKELTRMQI